MKIISLTFGGGDEEKNQNYKDSLQNQTITLFEVFIWGFTSSSLEDNCHIEINSLWLGLNGQLLC